MMDMMVGSQKFFVRPSLKVQPLRNRDGRWKRGYAEKRAYQWFFLFICVARSA